MIWKNESPRLQNVSENVPSLHRCILVTVVISIGKLLQLHTYDWDDSVRWNHFKEWKGIERINLQKKKHNSSILIRGHAEWLYI